ncbi:unnamed protein product [Parnassius mnemosyne]
MRRTGGGPPEGGPTLLSDNVVDAICPFINLTVPGVIDSNSIEISDDLTQSEVDIKKGTNNNVLNLEVVTGSNTKIVTNLDESENCDDYIEVMNVDTNFISEVHNNVPSKPKKRKEISTTTKGLKKFCSETEVRIKRCTINMQQDAELHELRLNRERVLLKREKNLINFEKQLHSLQLEKIKMEIELLKKQLEN